MNGPGRSEGEHAMRRNGFKTAWPVSTALQIGLAVSLGACSMLPGGDAPLGTTVTSGVETGVQRQDMIARKEARDTLSSSFAGAVVADEPAAALAARNVLEKGGNAADAATALYFALSVTYPAAAGLGGGGVCLAHEAEKSTVDSIAFLTRRPAEGGAIAIPGNVRGFALLQARHGSQPWAELVSPAERLAATGFPVSRAFGRQLADAAPAVAASGDLARLYAHADGRPYQELDSFSSIGLAATLAHIRSRGAAGFYEGETGRLLVAQARAKGGLLTAADLYNYRPEVSAAQTFASGNVNVALPARGLGSGAFAATLWNNIRDVQGESALAEAGVRTAIALGAPASQGAALDGDFGSTSFAVVDGKGGAVACAVTMNGAFGSGQTADGTGVVFAATPQEPLKGLASAFLVPVMIVNPHTSGLHAAGAGAGAPKGAASIEHAMQRLLSGNGDAAAALAAGPADARSPANAIVCPAGLPAGTCTLAVNPKGNGVGFGAVAAGR